MHVDAAPEARGMAAQQLANARRISDAVTSRPSLRAAAWASPISNTEAGFPTLVMIANR